MTITRICIEEFTKPLKKMGRTKANGKINNEPITVDLDKLVINYRSELITLERMAGTKGGSRYYFHCPKCDKRCRVLYNLTCGSCQNIYDTTLKRSKTDCQYYWELALKEARKVQSNYTPKRGRYMFDGFPSRPKGMKRKRYFKHYRNFQKYSSKGDSLWLR